MANFNGTSNGDIFTGGTDNDTAVGNGGNDTLSGGDGNDLLIGNSGSDALDGGDGNDTLYSGDESPPFNIPYYFNPYTPPLLDTGSEVDTLTGGAGDDVIFAGYGDNVDGGTSSVYGDKLFISFMGASAGVTADFRLATQVIGGGTITGIENVSWVQGSNFDDDINVGSGNGNGYSDFTAVFGMGGNDHLVAGYYTGSMFGGDGNDVVDGRGSQYLQTVDGGDGDDTLYTNSNTFATAYGGAGNDTIYSHGTTYGGSGNDTIILSFSYYGGIVYGEDGDDFVQAASSGNTIAGGNGADTLNGDAGTDSLYSAGFLNGTPVDDMALDHDILAGFGGNDTLAAGYGDDVDGGSGTDVLRYSLGGATSSVTFDTAGIVTGQPFVFAGGTINGIETLKYLRGSEFADTLNLATQAQLLTVDGGAGDDVITSHNSSVAVSGGAGADRFISGAAGDSFDGGTGTDTVDYSGYASAVTVALGLAAGSTGSGAGGDQLLNVENVDGSAFGDTISGSDDANLIRGLAGNDTLDGKGGNDTLDGGTGADSMSGGLGNDIFYVDDAGDQALESSNQGNDIVYAGVSFALGAGQSVETLMAASPGALSLTGNELANTLIGNNADNILTGGGGNDSLDGGVGADMMIGGTGNDFYFVEQAGDIVVEAVGEGSDRVFAGLSYTLAAGVEVELLTTDFNAGSGAIDLTGNEFANTIYGNAGVNTLSGAAGNDTLVGLGGNDVLIGGAGVDATYGGAGDDFHFVDNAADLVVEAVGEGNDRVFASVSYTLAAGAEVEMLTTDFNAGTDAINLTGNSWTQAIYGNAGANQLAGGGGADTLIGFGGDDWYFITDGREAVVETAGGGNDRVFAAVSYTLAAGADVELLTTDFNAGTAAINLTGNELSNIIYGNEGANTLSGAAGNDTLIGLGGNDVLIGGTGVDATYGGAGNDFHFVDNAADQVIENAGEGNDRVFASVSYALAASAEVETLSTDFNPGTDAINLTGNSGTQAIYGNAGANQLAGGGGADTLVGFGGDDWYFITDGRETVVETAGGGNDRVFAGVSYTLAAGADVELLTTDFNAGTGAIDLTGNELANAIYGNDGVNTLNGGAGSDSLIGFGGADTFAFTTALGATNVDTIVDFAHGADKIALDDAVFTAIGGLGALDPNAFFAGTAAHDADDRIIYDQATGSLFFDADGNGAGAAILFATLQGAPAITASDFQVI